MARKLLLTLLIFSLAILISNSPAYGISIHQEKWNSFLTTNLQKLDENPEDPLALFRVSVGLASLGEVDDSMEYFGKVSENHDRDFMESFLNELLFKLEEDPKNPVLLNQVAFAYFTLQRHREAEEYFQLAIQQDPENYWLYNYKSFTLVAQLNNEEAIDALETSLSIKNDNYTHAILGYVYWINGNRIKAWWHFARTGTLFFEIRRSLGN